MIAWDRKYPRKRLWDCLGGTQVKTNMDERGADCGSDSKVLAEQDRNKVEVIERKKNLKM